VTKPDPGTRPSTCARRKRTSAPPSDALHGRLATSCVRFVSSTRRKGSGRSAHNLYPSGDHIERRTAPRAGRAARRSCPTHRRPGLAIGTLIE
jgi:hypothetical protein